MLKGKIISQPVNLLGDMSPEPDTLQGDVSSGMAGYAYWGKILGDMDDQGDLKNALNLKADISDIPTKVSDLTNDSGFITGIDSSDISTALGYTPADADDIPTKVSELSNDSGFLTSVDWSDISSKPSFATVATSGSYTDLTDKPSIPTVNNATLTIQKNGTDVATFTANSSSNTTANITVPEERTLFR